MRRRKLLVPVLASAIAFLMAAGAGTAYAVLSAQANATITASPATIGIETADHSVATGLAVGYNQATHVYSDAGAVTIQNTGSREAWYSLTVSVADESADGLKSVIHVGAYVVADAADCVATTLPSATLDSGSWSWESTSATPTRLDASGGSQDSAVLCIQTWLPDTEISHWGASTIDLDIETSLAYTDPAGAANTNWIATGDFDTGTTGVQPLAVHQMVVTQDIALLFDNPIGRYRVSNVYADGNGDLVDQGIVCKGSSLDMPARFDGRTIPCDDDWNSQWRFVPVPGQMNVWWILQAINGYQQPTTPRWSITDPDDAITDQAPDDNDPDQMWILEGRGDGTYRIKADSATIDGDPVCATVVEGKGSYTALEDHTSLLMPLACDGNDAAQGFRLDLVGNPLPSTVLDGNGDEVYPDGYPLACTGAPDNLDFSWPDSTEYEQEVLYRLYYDDVIVNTWSNGYDRNIRLNDVSAGVQAWWTAHGSGSEASAQVTLQQQITSLGGWTTITAPITVWVDHSGTHSVTYCSQQVTATPTPTPTPTATPTPTPTNSGPASTPGLTASWAQQDTWGGNVNGNLTITNNTGSTVNAASVVIQVSGATATGGGGNMNCTYNGSNTFTCTTLSWFSVANGATSSNLYEQFTGPGISGTGAVPVSIISVTKIS